MTEEREHHLVLADQLIQQGDPRGELAVIHDRIMEAHRTKDRATQERLLPQAVAIVEANLSEWLGFEVDVKGVSIDLLDGDLEIRAGDEALMTMRWGFINRYLQLQIYDLDSLVQLWGRPAARLAGFGLYGLNEGELAQFLDVRDRGQITDVHLAGSRLNQADLDALVAMPKLRSFGCYHCSGVNDDAIAYVAGRGLERLWLAGRQFTCGVFGRLPLDALEHLAVRSMAAPFDEESLFRLRDASKLRSLELGSLGEVSEDALSWIDDLRRLEELILTELQSVGRPTLRMLARLPALSGVHIVATGPASELSRVVSKGIVRIEPHHFSNDLLESLCRLPFVRGLDISAVPDLRDQDLRCLSQLPDLRSLSITDCPLLEGSFVASLDRLQHLSLDHCVRIRDDALATLPSIRQLSLFGCNAVNGRFLDGLPMLRALDLGRVELDDAAFDLLLRQTELRELDLSETTLSNARLRAIVDAMPKLAKLSLRLSRGISSSGFLALSGLKDLTHVELAGTTFRHRDRFEGVAAFSPRHEPLTVAKLFE